MGSRTPRIAMPPRRRARSAFGPWSAG